MNVAFRKPTMTREGFLDWAAVQNERYEFDGFRPVAMVGRTRNHNQIAQNTYFALRTRLRGSACTPLGPDAGVATVGDAVRYPDGLVTCTRQRGTDRLITGVVVVFEVLSPSSGRIDRIDKLREYRAVPSILRYVVLEYRSAALTVFERIAGEADWRATPLTDVDMLRMPEIGIEIPVGELFEDVDFSDAETAG